MTTRYTNSDGQEYDKDGLPISRPTRQSDSQAGGNYTQYNPYQQNYSPTPTAFPAPGMVGQPGYPAAPKSKVIAALLFFFLGHLGVGNFYLHQNGRGIAKLLLGALGWLTVIFLIGIVPLAIVGIWSFVEAILVLTGTGGYDRDGRGVPLD